MEALSCFLIFAVGALSTFFLVSTGGTGMITVPILIFLGLSPHSAIATDLFGMFGGALSGFYKFWKEKKTTIREGLSFALLAAAGAILGAYLQIRTSEELLEKFIGAILLLTLILFLLQVVNVPVTIKLYSPVWFNGSEVFFDPFI